MYQQQQRAISKLRRKQNKDGDGGVGKRREEKEKEDADEPAAFSLFTARLERGNFPTVSEFVSFRSVFLALYFHPGEVGGGEKLISSEYSWLAVHEKLIPVFFFFFFFYFFLI